MDERLINDGGLAPKRPNMNRLREGVGAHEAAGWIEHLEAEREVLLLTLAEHGIQSVAEAATIGSMTIDPKAVMRGAAMGLPLSGASTLKLLAVLDETIARAEQAEAVLDAVDTPAFPAAFARWQEFDDGAMRPRTAYPDPDAPLPVEVDELPGAEVSVTVEPPA